MKKIIEITKITNLSELKPIGFYQFDNNLYICSYNNSIPMYCGVIAEHHFEDAKETSSISENLLLKTIAVLQEPSLIKDLSK